MLNVLNFYLILIRLMFSHNHVVLFGPKYFKRILNVQNNLSPFASIQVQEYLKKNKHSFLLSSTVLQILPPTLLLYQCPEPHVSSPQLQESFYN